MAHVTLSIVLPCFNEEQNIGPSVRDVFFWLRKANIDGEIIVVNDGSTDDTALILRDLQCEFPELVTVHHPINEGYGAAVRSGCDRATKELIGFMDSDGQFRAEDFDRLLRAMTDVSFIAGRRRSRADSALRGLYGKILGLIVWLLFRLWVRDVNCGMKLFRRSLWPHIRPTHGIEKMFNTEMFLALKRLGIPWRQVDVPHYPRRAVRSTGASIKTLKRMVGEIRALSASPVASSAAAPGDSAGFAPGQRR